MPQTSVLDTPVPYVAGQDIFPGRQPHDVVTARVQTAALDVGLFVAAGTADDQVIAPAAAGDATGVACRGVVLYDPTAEPGQKAVGDIIPVMRKGFVAVVAAAGAYTKGQAVNIRYAGTGTKGSIVQAAVGGETAVCAYAEVAETKTLGSAGSIIVEVRR